MDNLVRIGFSKKPHGIKGELKLQAEERYVQDLLEAEVIFIDIKGKPAPFFVESIREGNELLVKLEDVDTREAAEALGSKALFLPEVSLQPMEKEETGLVQLIDFQIETPLLGRIGIIEDVLEYPQQLLAVVAYQGREVLIPLHENLITAIDQEQRIVHMDLPQGLLEL